MQMLALLVLALLTAPDSAPLITGTVVNADGSPAARAMVTLRAVGYVRETTTEEDGSFRVEQLPFMTCELTATSRDGGFTRPFWIELASRGTLALPPIHLNRPVYAIMRIVSPTGEPIENPRIISQFRDFAGRDLSGSASIRTNVGPERGSVRIGPLPRGAALFGIDRPPFARRRLDPQLVTGASAVLDLGTIKLDPGATVNVELVDESNTPVAGRDVYLEDPMLASPITAMRIHTDDTGRGAFDRVGPGQYRVWTEGLRLCADKRATIVRKPVSIQGGGTASVRMNVGGFRQELSLTWNDVPMAFQPVAITSAWTGETVTLREGTTSVLDLILKPRPGVWNEVGCTEVTDARGHAVITNVPAGPASVSVAVLDSTWIKQIDVPARPSALTLDIPGGNVLIRVSNAETGAPVEAEVTATSGGARIVTRAGPDGSAVLQGIADSGAAIHITQFRFQPADLTLDAIPDTVQEVSLVPMAHSSLVCRAAKESDEPIAGVVVELIPDTPTEDVQVKVTDASGVARVNDLHPGSARLLAAASGYVTASQSVTISSADRPVRIAITLARGSR